MQSDDRAARLQRVMRRGLAVFAILAALTVVEWFVGTEVDPNIAPLAVIAFIKAGLIVWYFMHVYRLWSSEEAAG